MPKLGKSVGHAAETDSKSLPPLWKAYSRYGRLPPRDPRKSIDLSRFSNGNGYLAYQRVGSAKHTRKTYWKINQGCLFLFFGHNLAMSIFAESISHPGNVLNRHPRNADFLPTNLVLVGEQLRRFAVPLEHLFEPLLSLLPDGHQFGMTIDSGVEETFEFLLLLIQRRVVAENKIAVHSLLGVGEIVGLKFRSINR